MAFAQLDPDYLDNKKKGDDCFAKKDYDCAEKHYTVAKIIKTDDEYCLTQIEKCKKNKVLDMKMRAPIKPKSNSNIEIADNCIFQSIRFSVNFGEKYLPM